MIQALRRENSQAQESAPNPDAPKKNCFSTLLPWGEQEESLDVVIAMLQVFSISIYALLYPCATLSFVTSLVARKFDDLDDILNEPFQLQPRWVTPLWIKEPLRVVPYLFPIELLRWIL